jgi:curved DNA binding protein
MVDEPTTAAPTASQEVDYSLANPDVLSKYKDAAAIAHRVLDAVLKLAVNGVTVLSICEQGDKLLEEETAKVYKGKKICKGIAFPTTVSPNDILTPYTPLSTDAAEATITISNGDVLKIQLGAQIDGFPAIISDTIVVGESNSDTNDLILASHFCNEALLRLMLPADVHPSNTPEKPYKVPSSHEITETLKKIAAVYGCTLVESTTSFVFARNEIEGKKRIVVLPGEGVPKSEGTPEVGEVWGVELALSKGSGKVKEVPGKRATLHRKTDTKLLLKRETSRATLNEVLRKFGSFPFGLRQLEDERTAKMGIVECVRGNVIRQFEVLGDKDGAVTSRLFTTVAINKAGITKLAGPTPPDLSTITSEKRIEDEAIQKLLETPLKTEAKGASKKKKKKSAKKEEE